jgi:hypothetical protein
MCESANTSRTETRQRLVFALSYIVLAAFGGQIKRLQRFFVVFAA